MNKKRAMAESRWRLNPPNYKSVSYTLNTVGGGTVNLTEFLNELHSIQLDCIDDALEQSDLKEAKDVIEMIKGKL